MMVFRGCSKCQGDVYVEYNIDGADAVCLQCGCGRLMATSNLPRSEPAPAKGWDLQRAVR
jgi:hypothetical protein